MRRLNAIIILAVLFLIPSPSHSSDLSALRISLIRGDVQLRDDARGEWYSAVLNMPLREGDTLLVSDRGRAEIQMNDGSFLRLDEDSTLRIIMISNGIMWFELKEGRAYVNFKGRGERTIKIGIPYLTTLRTDEPSKFSIDFYNHRYTEVSVLKGAVYADVRGDNRWIYAGQRFTTGEDMYADISTLGPSDEWQRWNMQRDRRLEDNWYSYRYLPDELRVYAYEFDTNGRWVYTTRYGYVWTPTVYITTEWSPYRTGRWVWIGDDYVWVSYEPWGWVPYHYGRWAFSISIGWFWVPPSRGAVYWGPGYVGWIHTPSYIAWVPLAPEDIYYGYGYYGPRSVNIVHIDIHKTVVRNVYRNVYVKRAVTVVKRDSFKRGRYVIRTDVNPFIRERVQPQRTRIVSDRVSLLPVRREIVVKHEPVKRTIRNNDRRTYEEGRIINRGQTIGRRPVYPERAKREIIKTQRKEVRNAPVRYRSDSLIQNTRTTRNEQRIRRDDITKRHIKTPVIRNKDNDRFKPRHKQLRAGGPGYEKRIHNAEKKTKERSGRQYIKKNRDRSSKGMVHRKVRRGMELSRWMRR